jgi:hypothetical protein
MHSNFVTPPDYVETILIINATSEQIKICAETVQTLDRPYTVYFYDDQMNDPVWLERITKIADTILKPAEDLTNPADYFTK